MIKSPIGKFLDFIIDSLQDFKPFYKHINSHFQNIYSFIKISPFIGEYLLRKGLIIKYISFVVSAEKSVSSELDEGSDVQDENETQTSALTRNYQGSKKLEYSSDDLLNANLSYLWIGLSYLIRRASNFYTVPLDSIPHKISAYEKGCIVSEGTNVDLFLKSYSSQSSTNALIRLFADLCYSNSEVSKIMLTTLQEGLSEKENHMIETWFKFSKAMIKIADKFKERVSIFLL